MVDIEFSDPGLIALYLSIYMFTGFTLLVLIFLVVKSGKRRVSPIYLSGEPEEAVEEPLPGPAHFYWGFMRRFARRLYNYLLNRMHTGSLQDWIDYMFSWYGLLVLVSIILGIIYYVLR